MTRAATKDKILRRDAFPVPQNTEVKGVRCLKIYIPDDDSYELLTWSCLTLLTRWNSYQQDGHHKAADAATLFRSALWDNPFEHCQEEKTPGGEVDGLDMASLCELLRWHNGKLQAYCCGEWQDISGDGPSQDLVQRTDGGEGPSGGACQDFNIVLQGSGKYLLPIPVSSGYTLEFTALKGGWTDNGLVWYCANGQGYTLGECSGSGTTDPGDPLPSTRHMAVVAEIDGTFYSCIDGKITVPAGVTNANVTFQANDSDITNNYGSVSFKVTVCNKNQPSFTHHFDFRTGLQGWTVCTAGATPPLAAWISGTGVQVTNPSAIPAQGVLEVSMDMPFTLYNVTVRFVADVPNSGFGENGIYINDTGSLCSHTPSESHPTSAVPIDLTAAISIPVTRIRLEANADYAGNTCTITDCYITALGEDPF